ncbi:MAG: SRPBCC family protein [Thermoleophilaceae bacterium]|nr:SRPBCC family protein [Thermoleophilaceae bacterium]
MRVAEARGVVPLEPAAALALWLDTERWPTFVEGFGHVTEADPSWPEPGARIGWESTPGGRGKVTERIVERGAGRVVSQVFEDALSGTQTVRFLEAPGGAAVEVALEYALARGGPLRELADMVFIRRALRDALRRTLRRFAVEAEDEAGLR